MRTRRRTRSNGIGITGTPGTGKKTVAPLVARALGFQLIDLNALAVESGCSETTPKGTVVDVGRLRRALLNVELQERVIFGHLLPEVFERGILGFVAVIRCDPQVLKQRLSSRGYSHALLIENVEAELIGVLLSEALAVFGERHVGEFDSTNSDPAVLSRRIVRAISGHGKKKARWIDWTTRYDSVEKLASVLPSERTDP